METTNDKVVPQATVDTSEIRKLASRLQNVAYSHGCTDSRDYSSDKKYIDAADKSDAALRELLTACESLATPPTSKAAAGEIHNSAPEPDAARYRALRVGINNGDEWIRIVGSLQGSGSISLTGDHADNFIDRALKSATPSTDAKDAELWRKFLKIYHIYKWDYFESAKEVVEAVETHAAV